MSGSWPSTDVAGLAEWIAGRTGLTFAPQRRTQAAAAIQKALRASGAPDAAAFRRQLERDSAALDDLLAELTIGETYFFRQPEQLDLIRAEILPTIDPYPARPLRLWSAGCASGEEAYSLAIIMGESGRAARVVGTDLSKERLAVARRGRYGEWSLRGVPNEVIEQYFSRNRATYELLPTIRAAVEFRYLNLVEDRYPALSTGIWGMDLILCRNVLIYLDRDSIRRVARKLVDSLSDQGWLLMGASDPLVSDLAPVDVVVTDAGLVYRRRTTAEGGTGEAVRWRRDPPPAPAPPPPEPGPMPAPEPPPALDRVEAAPPPEAPPSGAEEDGLAAELARVRALADQGRLAEAGRACASALDRHRDSAELLYLHALLLLAGGEPAAAAAAARRALYLDRGLIVAHLLMGDALQRAGDGEGATRSLRRAQRLLAELPGDAEVPAADGEPAGRLLRMVETRIHLMKAANS